MTTTNKKRIVPAKVKDRRARAAAVKRAARVVRPKVRIDFERSVRG